jgi:tetratricopeptide (TPR) repeat protein
LIRPNTQGMRFDPHADFVSDPLDAPMPGEMGERSPLKTASVIFLIAIVAGLGGWLWIEGVPGQQKAAAETAAVDADLPKIEPEVVQYAEALISGRNEAERVAAATGSKVDPVVTVRARRSDPGSPVYQAYQQGKRLMSVGRYPEALPYLLEAVRLDPEFAEAHYRLGLTYVRLGDMKAARRERAKLEKLDVDLANLLAHLVNY